MGPKSGKGGGKGKKLGPGYKREKKTVDPERELGPHDHCLQTFRKFCAKKKKCPKGTKQRHGGRKTSGVERFKTQTQRRTPFAGRVGAIEKEKTREGITETGGNKSRQEINRKEGAGLANYQENEHMIRWRRKDRKSSLSLQTKTKLQDRGKNKTRHDTPKSQKKKKKEKTINTTVEGEISQNREERKEIPRKTRNFFWGKGGVSAKNGP